MNRTAACGETIFKLARIFFVCLCRGRWHGDIMIHTVKRSAKEDFEEFLKEVKQFLSAIHNFNTISTIRDYDNAHQHNYKNKESESQ